MALHFPQGNTVQEIGTGMTTILPCDALKLISLAHYGIRKGWSQGVGSILEGIQFEFYLPNARGSEEGGLKSKSLTSRNVFLLQKMNLHHAKSARELEEEVSIPSLDALKID
jgi:hypothetical protein